MSNWIRRTALICQSVTLSFSLLACAVGGGSDRSSDTQSGTLAGSASQTTEKTTDDASTSPQDQVKRVIILSGQSNAVGHSFRKFLPDAQNKISAERVERAEKGWENIRIMYSNNPFNGSKDASDDFLPVTFGYGLKFTDVAFGPEVGLAEYLNERFPGEEFYIIKCATGGSDFFAMWNPETTGEASLYADLLRFTDKAMKKLTSDGSKVEIIGFLWNQGESDCSRGGDYHDSRFESYNTLFEKLLDGFCEKFAEYLPDGPEGMALIQAGMTSFWPRHTAMNQAKRRYCVARGNAAFFNTYDLTTNLDNSDHAHFDAAAMFLLGNRFGETLIKTPEDAGRL